MVDLFTKVKYRVGRVAEIFPSRRRTKNPLQEGLSQQLLIITLVKALMFLP